MSSSSAIRLDKVGIWEGASLVHPQNSSTAGVHLKDHGTHHQDGVYGLEILRGIAWVSQGRCGQCYDSRNKRLCVPSLFVRRKSSEGHKNALHAFPLPKKTE
jgi:hypothetical protein